jgi:REP element-mobilizing transposase RayT
MSQSLAAVYVHLVFSTKERRPFLQETSRAALHDYLGGISKTLQCPVLRVGGVEDHVHILARLGRSMAIADWAKEMKRVSSVWLHERGPDMAAFAWQAGYGIFSVSQSNLEKVTAYIERQEIYHRKLTFQDELRALLQRHHLAFDERMLGIESLCFIAIARHNPFRVGAFNWFFPR